MPTVIGTNMDDGASWSLDYNQTESDFKAMFAKQDLTARGILFGTGYEAKAKLCKNVAGRPKKYRG